MNPRTTVRMRQGLLTLACFVSLGIGVSPLPARSDFEQRVERREALKQNQLEQELILAERTASMLGELEQAMVLMRRESRP